MSVYIPNFEALPDYKTALIGYLREHQDFVKVVSPRKIVTKMTDVTGDPGSGNWLVIVATGGWGSYKDVPMCHAFIMAHCYGSTGNEAMHIWRTLKSLLQPPDPRWNGFTYRGCQFHDFVVGMPNEMIDPGVRAWEKRIAVVEARFCEVPSAVQVLLPANHIPVVVAP